jgi:Cof subfamily protein (haloacid dehalogenase superfamily)
MTNTIQLIAIDLDGTLLNSQHQMTERTEKALRAAIEKGIQVVLATGKTRNAAQKIITQLGLTSPGIFLQGLAVYNGDGSIKHQTHLDPSVARQVVTFAEDRGFTVLAYSGTNVYARKRNRDIEVILAYDEREPEYVGALQNIINTTPINKLLAMDMSDRKRVAALRWQLKMQLDRAADLTQAAIPEMLEIIPRGASKGAALKLLLKDLQIPAENVLALGDGENDIEMLQMAGIGVAMGNALQQIKDVADHVTSTNDADGVAEAIEKFVLKTEEPVATSPEPASNPE